MKWGQISEIWPKTGQPDNPASIKRWDEHVSKTNLKYSSPLVLMQIVIGKNIASGALVSVCARAEENTMQYFEINKKTPFQHRRKFLETN